MLNYENKFGFCSGLTTTHVSMVENKLHPSGKSLGFRSYFVRVSMGW